ncbi:MAG: aminotransferase class V-fold PLP-dependent enzyme [Pararhodobacter sp.]
MPLDLNFVRAQFPAFAEPSLAGQAFFENAGGSYACQPVIDRLTRFYHQRKVQPYHPFEAARLGGEEMDEARSRLAALLGVATEEVSFGPSTTANTYVLAQAFRQHLKPGDAIIVTNQDHEANTGPWRRLAEEGIEVREWQIDPATGQLPLERLALLLPGAKLVCYPHVSNVVGAVNPVAEIGLMAHEAGALTCVDGVSYVPHGFPHVPGLGADIYLFSAYKTYGPHQGIMVIRKALGMKLPAQGHHFNADVLYKRFTPAGPDHAQIAACAGMADYVDALAAHHGGGDLPPPGRAELVHDLMRAHETEMLAPLLDYLNSRNEVRLLGPQRATERAPTVAVQTARPAGEIARDLAGLGIMAGAGDFYAGRALKAQGVDPASGVLRLSFVHYTSPGEVDQLIRALDRVL